jgi:hypothetical protein
MFVLWRYQRILTLVCLFVGGSSSFVFAQWACLSTQEELTTDFLWSLVQADNEGTLSDLLVTRKDDGVYTNSLIEWYCDTWLQTHSVMNKDVTDMVNVCADSGNMRFDPRQSLFMYGLCVGYDEAHKGKESLKTSKPYKHRDWKSKFVWLSYTTKVNSKWDKWPWTTIPEDISLYIPEDSQDAALLQKRRWLDKENDPCQPEKWMDECMMWYPTKNILHTVFSWLFDLKKAAIDGYKYGTQEQDIEAAIKDLSFSLYDQIWPSTTICSDTNKQFIMKQDSGANEKQSHCWHYTTWWEIKEKIESAIKDVDRVTQLDGHAIAEAECKGIKENLIPCALSNLQRTTEGREEVIYASEEWAWRNLILNELFFADMWIEFYSMILKTEPTRKILQWWSVLNKNVRIDVELEAMRNDFDMIERSVDRMMNLLGQYRTMYHQCITLKAYQEDIQYYRTRVNKMYTPIHQLQFTTNDAQEKNLSK